MFSRNLFSPSSKLIFVQSRCKSTTASFPQQFINDANTNTKNDSLSNFSISDLFTGKTQSRTITYPWLLSNQPSRLPSPTFWSAFRGKHLVVAGTTRAQKHLHSPKAYDFPFQFNVDAGAITLELLKVLSDPQQSCDEDILRSIMIKPLAEKFYEENLALREAGDRVEFIVLSMKRDLNEELTNKQDTLQTDDDPSTTKAVSHVITPAPPVGNLREADSSSEATSLSIRERPLLAKIQESYLANTIRVPRVSITNIHFKYGPFPQPENYVEQHWWSLITLVIPSSDNAFISHPRQQEIMKIASDQGVVIRINVSVDFDALGGVEFVYWDKNGIPVVRDKRRKLDLEFISPHFTPWDELFELDEHGKWKLRFNWRISDIDGLLASSAPEKNLKHTINWTSRTL